MATYNINPHSQSWKEAKRFHEEGIAKAQRTLEQPGVDSIKTEYFRGIIKAHRDALELGQGDSE